MKRFFFTIYILLIAATMSAQEKNFIDQNYIEVTASAESKATPDEIYINITINEKDTKSGFSLEKKEKEMLKALTSLGIDLKTDLQIQDMSTLLQKYMLKKDAVMTSKSYMLKVHSSEMLIKVFKEMETLSIPDVNIDHTSLSNSDEIEREVMAMAAEKAKKDASILAKALGRTLGDAIYIQSYDSRPRIMAAAAMSMRKSEDSFIAPSLDFEKITFEHSVLVRFKLE